MRNILTAHEAPINKIFCADYTLVVPEYQRPYAWTVEEAETLLDDLLEHLNKNGGKWNDEINPYFLGCAVLSKKSGKPHAEIVDGQQRLSTLTILLASLRYRLQHTRPASSEKAGSRIFPKFYSRPLRLCKTGGQ